MVFNKRGKAIKDVGSRSFMNKDSRGGAILVGSDGRARHLDRALINFQRRGCGGTGLQGQQRSRTRCADADVAILFVNEEGLKSYRLQLSIGRMSQNVQPV